MRLRAVDGNGRPVQGARLSVGEHGMVRTDEAGEVTLQLACGQQSVNAVPPATVETVSVPEGEGTCDVVVVLASATASIDGIVVDERGFPIERAAVTADTDGSPYVSVRSGADGAFAVARPTSATDKATTLTVQARGFEVTALQDVVWNTNALRIALRGGADVELRVRGPDGTPVERCAADLWPDPIDYMTGLHAAGTFPRGIAFLPGARRGPAHLFVRPEDHELGNRLFVACTIGDGRQSPAEDDQPPAFRSVPRRRSTPPEQGHAEQRSRRRFTWAQLMMRCFGIDVLVCPRCRTRRQLLTFITDPHTTARILEHLGLCPEPPPLAPARAPPGSGVTDFI